MHPPTMPPPRTGHPFEHGNRFQRAYLRYAQPHYERIGLRDPALRAEVEEIDRFLYSRQGALAWLGWGLGGLGVVFGLHNAGMPWLPSALLGMLLWAAVSVVVLAAWLAPAAPATPATNGRPVALRRMLVIALMALVAAALGVAFGQWLRSGSFSVERVLGTMGSAAGVLLLVGLGSATVFGVVAAAGRRARAQRLARAELLAERDAARAQAAEADLRLLQAQIQPHFVFNTLATLQHWVDKGDPRAGALLRELSGFLRYSTELLGRPRVPLAEELQAVQHYVACLEARLQGRLRAEFELDAGCGAYELPPGMVLTLVENAIAHGLEPKIGGGTLQVRTRHDANGWQVQVCDDGLGLAPGTQDRVGLRNLRQRLQHHAGERGRFSLQARQDGGVCAEIHLAHAA